jgi:hypothetical protein
MLKFKASLIFIFRCHQERVERLGHDANSGLDTLVSDSSQWFSIQLAVDYAEPIGRFHAKI